MDKTRSKAALDDTETLDRIMNYFIAIIIKTIFGTIFERVKKVIAIAFIFLLSAQCIFKLGIITYFQANRDYIAEVLCVNKEKPITMCYGKCFLDRNLSLADEGTPKQQIPTANKLQLETSPFIADSFDISLMRSSSEMENVSSPQPLYHFYSQRSFFHPPC